MSNNNSSYQYLQSFQRKSKMLHWLTAILLFAIIFLFIPWTQNIRGKGKVTSLRQEGRTQEINSPIPGKIQKWFVKEGDLVRKGDTILQLAEIKEDYLDPELVDRTREQMNAKSDVIASYEKKVNSIDGQIDALTRSKALKLEQLRNKLIQLDKKLSSENAELVAVNNEYTLTKDQFDRQEKLFKDGLVSQTQLQQRNVAFQNVVAKQITVENKIAQTQQEIINCRIEQNSVDQEFNEKISKSESDRFQSMSQISGGKGELAKLKNQVQNYTIRNGMYFLLAAQNGQVVQAKSAGLGEIIKEGEKIASIVPNQLDLAVEMYVRPVDLPLIAKGEKVRLIFDGYPTIVFSGWPKGSYGTFGGVVVANENSIGENGMFRILVSQDPNDQPWPQMLKLGSGSQGIALLKNVPIWYEIWRNMNGFPPDYYIYEKTSQKEKAK
jgi:multidrug resistance efflux pump